MGRYKWSYKSPNMGYNYNYVLITPLISTHEPPSSFGSRTLAAGPCGVSEIPVLRVQHAKGSANFPFIWGGGVGGWVEVRVSLGL